MGVPLFGYFPANQAFWWGHSQSQSGGHYRGIVESSHLPEIARHSWRLLAFPQIGPISDQTGDYPGNDTAVTWVIVRCLDRSQCAENRNCVSDSVQPTFVSILRWQSLGVKNNLQPVPFARRHHQITAANASPVCGRSARRAPR